jgi:dTDP-4-amino-4,6-dideoxygalactose transaminase
MTNVEHTLVPDVLAATEGNVQAFERDFAQYVGSKHCVMVNSGSSAILLMVAALFYTKNTNLKLTRGDEVIVPSHTFIATWLAATSLGAKLVPVDIDPKTYNICPIDLARKVSKKSKVILVVHLYGQPASLDEITKIARSNNIPIVEDAAQAHGAAYRGKKIGQSGNLVAWSFYPGKNLGAFGDAGAITTDNLEWLRQIKKLSNYGSEKKYIHEIQGLNCRMDELQAAILLAKLPHLDGWNCERRSIAAYYNEALPGSIDFVLPYTDSDAHHVWHLYVIRSAQRDELQAYLKQCGIETLIHYPCALHKQLAYKDTKFPTFNEDMVVEISSQVLSLPIWPLMAREKIDYVIESVKNFYAKG